MNPFLWNLVLAFTWSFAQGGLTAFHFSVGFLLGYAVLWITGDVLQ
jgi:multisubunit Na+/H+ antiporter MnhE subunit